MTTIIKVTVYTGDVMLSDETINCIIDEFIKNEVFTYSPPHLHPVTTKKGKDLRFFDQEEVEIIKEFLLEHGAGKMIITKTCL